MRDIIIGIDAGTSVIKSIAFAMDGRQLAAFALPNSYATLPGGGAEQDMARTWADTAATLRGLATVLPDLAGRTAAIAVTGQGDGTWLIDDDGRPVQPAWLWLDARAGALVRSIRATSRNQALFALTGTGLNACQQGAQLAQMQFERPGALARSATAFHCKDWLYFNLTGVRATDPSEGTFTFGNFRQRVYAPEVLALLGLEDLARLRPPMIDGTVVTDKLSPEAAAASGLPAGIPVALGYVDVICTALGAGLFDRTGKSGCTIIGSTGMHMRMALGADAVTLNSDATGYTMAFPVPGTYAQMQSNMASTLNIDWLLDLARGLLATHGVTKSRAELLVELEDQVMQRPAGSVLYHPYISDAGERGPFVDPAARAQFSGLGLQTGYADLMRAVYEGLAFAARDCYAAMGSLPGEVRLTGGAARSPAIRAIFAAVLGAGVRTSSRDEAGAAGAAMIAAVATGAYANMEACADAWVTPLLGAIQAPDSVLAGRYDRLFPAYVAGRTHAQPVWQALGTAR
jgi:erythritol kinase (D-erythritol 1-phosphate-forming)